MERVSVDGINYESLWDKPRHWRILKDEIVKHFSFITYELEDKIDFGWDIFEEGPNEIKEIDGKPVEVYEFGYAGYTIQLYREIELL